MRRLRHRNVIQFIEVFETADQLMMVMEYCPGQELFDVILSSRYLSEQNARPIFQQVCQALFYLHSLSIIHRDIKPENVLILNERDPSTGLPIAKILDFGLSKNAGGGSAAKTFVGTPCYLAPEVEYTSKGLGGTYGLPADCWSLGAVLYVMLVARFPGNAKFMKALGMQ
jgi:calcium-dependent protein kinase